MLERNDAWTGPFVAKNLQSQSEVSEVKVLAPQVLRIVRKKGNPFLIGTIASERVERFTIEPLLSSGFAIEFVANVPRESFWTGEAIKFASERSVGFGGMGDLFSAVSLANVREYVKKEIAFVERGLRQHSRVRDFERIHDRLYVLKREPLADVTVVLLNEYDLTADHVRTARDRYGSFSDILITNPNGRVTSSAEEAAESMGAYVHKWGEFLGRLNKR